MPKRKLDAELVDPLMNARRVRQRREDDDFPPDESTTDTNPTYLNDPSDEEDEDEQYREEILREGRSTLTTGRGVYTFHCKLLKTYDYEEIKEVSVTLLHNHANTAPLIPTKVGYLKGHLIPRPNPIFFTMADSISSEAQELSCLFCESNGKATRVSTPNTPTLPNTGGFFHIFLVELQNAHQGIDLGLHLIHKTLSFIGSDWSLSVMLPSLLNTRDMQWRQGNDRLNLHSSNRNLSRNQLSLRQIASTKIARHFARMGFEQAGRNVNQQHAWFLTKSSQRGPNSWLTKQHANRSIDIYKAARIRKPSGLEKQVVDVIRSARLETVNGSIAKLCALFKNGASLAAARAMHFAAVTEFDRTETCFALLGALVSLGGDVSGADEHGTTPLQLAAGMRHLDVIRFLVRAGADRRVCSMGKTALDMARCCDIDDFRAAFGLDASTKDTMKKFECLDALMSENEKGLLMDGFMAPRMKKALMITADSVLDMGCGVAADCVMGGSLFRKYKATPLHKCCGFGGIWRIEYIPADVLKVNGEGLYKSFRDGWFMAFRAIRNVLRQGEAPTVGRIAVEMSVGNDDLYDHRKWTHFVQKGGRLEYALDAVLKIAENVIKEGDDGWVYEMHQQEFERLPETALDDAFEVMRLKCFADGFAPRGPYAETERMNKWFGESADHEE